jgi:alpha-D-ribose 1-methylphosphonate 5-phosphate C-P lyase
VKPLEFDDHKFRIEEFGDQVCHFCGTRDAYLDEIIDDDSGRRVFFCSDTSCCAKTAAGKEELRWAN